MPTPPATENRVPRLMPPTDVGMPCEQAHPDSILFGHPYDIVDAMMLFGAMLEPVKAGSKRVRLVVGRSMQHWPSLAWAITTCWHNRLVLRMKGGEFGIREKLIFTSAGERWLEHALYRWYPDYLETGRRRAIVPKGLKLNEGMLACWLVTAMSRASTRPIRLDDNGSPVHSTKPIRLNAPRMSVTMARSLRLQMGPLTRRWQVGIRPAGTGFDKLVIPGRCYQEVEHWLAGAVPAQFWGRPEIMGAA